MRPYINIRLSISAIITFIAFFGAKLTLVIPIIYSRRRDNRTKKIAIEAGILGMKSVFFEELVDSAKEFYGNSNVISFTISEENSYLKQNFRNIREMKPDLLIVDPRTGSQFLPLALTQTMAILIFSRIFNFTPIVILTDASVFMWRIQAVILTANKKSNGVIITFLDFRKFNYLFPHKRIIGPSLIPISNKRITELEKSRKLFMAEDFEETRNISFLGSLYSKRKLFFEEINLVLAESSFDVKILFYEKNSNLSSQDYWNFLIENPISITTTFIQRNSRYYYDRSDINQMVFRISELLAVGNFFFCEYFPGVFEHFKDGQNICIYNNKEDLLEKIIYYFNNSEEMARVSKAGHDLYINLISNNFFWNEIELRTS